MNIRRRIICAFSAAVILVSIVGCDTRSNTDPKPQQALFFEYFDTVSTVYDYSGLSEAEFSTLSGYVESELSEYHRLYDIYNEYEGMINLASINRLAGTGKIKVDSRIADMLSFAVEMYNRTSGNLNIAMGSVLEIWHEYRTAEKEEKELPPPQLLQAAGEHMDIGNLIIDRENSTVELLDPEMSLDVGAVGKGYAVEMIACSLETRGYTSIVLDVGGNLRAIGTKPSGAGWNTGVKNPDPEKGGYVYKTELKNGAMVTSGSYQRFYTVGGVRYHHIINPRTLMPQNYYTSVSVMSDSSALSDALSTAIFNMTYTQAEEFVSGFSGILVVLVMPSGEVKVLNQRAGS